MNTPSSSSEWKTFISLVVGLMALGVVLMLLGCLVLLATPRVIDAVALRSLADQLGTEPSKAALVTHVTELLESKKGSSREQVHRLMDQIGGFSLHGPYAMKNGGSQEDAYWTMADLPLGMRIVAVWSLRYSADDQLLEVIFTES